MRSKLANPFHAIWIIFCISNFTPAQTPIKTIVIKDITSGINNSVQTTINDWIKKNKWSLEENTTKPTIIAQGHLSDDNTKYVGALFSVSDGGSNITQYVYLFQLDASLLVPIAPFKVGQKGTALINSVVISNQCIQVLGKIYKTDGEITDSICCPSIISKWVYKLNGDTLKLINGPKLPWIEEYNKDKHFSNVVYNATNKRSRLPVLSEKEQQQAELPYAKRIRAAAKNNPDTLPTIRMEASLLFICNRALKRVGFSQGGIDYFYQILNEEMNRHGGLLFAYEAGFRIAKQSVWSKRGWDDSAAKAKLKVLDKAEEDVHRILIGE